MLTSDQLLADLKLLHPKLIDLSLGRVERLLAKLGNPHRSLPPVVHIAGTNGKGSTTAYLKAILTAAGLRVHVYTSPHLVRFHERIALAGPDGVTRPIAEDLLVDVLSRTQAVNDGDDITQFEITT
ncbi:MAG TPA: bifunctional folylpolyglutamate synthase/dihydrofolate synthase, partial [Hyphomicrobium sp.]|nr:bifunctional folylpolyglutamate synthase/dihydrofolate synthase [Hyphomicrobium sp.]